MSSWLDTSILEWLFWPWLGGIIIALTSGPVGSFMVWRRMAYFGDTLAHGALLGIALGWLLNINLVATVILFSVMMAVLLSSLMFRNTLATDTLLGILSHGSLALGLVILSLFNQQPVDLMGILLGDILALGAQDFVWIVASCGLIILTLIGFWQPLVNHTLCPELAHVEGNKNHVMRMLLFVMVALMIAVAMRVVGILLITALLIIPAASARHLATSPENMAYYASGLGAIAVTLGIALSWWIDSPTGPSIVVVACMQFFILHLWARKDTALH